MNLRDWFLLVALSLLWSGSFFLAKIAVAEIHPATLSFLRVALAAAALSFMVWVAGGTTPRGGGTWKALAVMGLLNNALPFTLIFWAQTRMASGLAAILNATTPLFAALIAHFFSRDERLTTWRLIGIAVGCLGALFVIGFDGTVDDDVPLWAPLACLVAAFSYAAAGVHGRRRLVGLSPLVAAAAQLVMASLLMAPLAALFDPRVATLAVRPSPPVTAAILGLAVFCTAIAYVLYFRILARAGATNLLLVTLLIPPGTLALGAAFLGEKPEAEQLGGMMLIALGLVILDGRAIAAVRKLVGSGRE